MARMTRAARSSAAVDEVERGGCEVARCFIFEGIEEHSVDGEVAAQNVFARVGGVTHGIGTAAIGVGAIVAEGGDLGDEFLFFKLLANEYDAEVCADGEGLGEERDDLIGGGGGGDVEVLGRKAEQEIAHAAAGEEGLVTGVAQAAGDGERGEIRRVGREFALHVLMIERCAAAAD